MLFLLKQIKIYIMNGLININEIIQFANEHNLEFGINRKGTPFVAINVKYDKWDGYDAHQMACYIQKVAYTFTTTDQENPISLRKIWYGYRSCKCVSKWMGKDYENNVMREFIANIESGKYDNKVVNVKQNLMGRYKTLEEAFNHIKLSMKNELKKSKLIKP